MFPRKLDALIGYLNQAQPPVESSILQTNHALVWLDQIILLLKVATLHQQKKPLQHHLILLPHQPWHSNLLCDISQSDCCIIELPIHHPWDPLLPILLVASPLKPTYWNPACLLHHQHSRSTYLQIPSPLPPYMLIPASWISIYHRTCWYLHLEKTYRLSYLYPRLKQNFEYP